MGQLADLGGVILLGVIQGLTEFLPVSSSGHLVVGQQLLDLAPPSLVFDLLLHVGTLLPVAWLYRRDLAAMVASLARLPQLGRRLGDDGALRLTVCVLVGSLPTALIGVSLKDFFEGLFSSVLAVGCAFLVTGAVLLVTRRRGTLEPDERALSLTPPRALVIGLAQGAAITPGISRSGATIAAGLLMGVERELAARFSFVLSIPAILGATVLHLRGGALAASGLGAPLLAAGTLAATAAGYLALRWVVHLVKRGDLHWFTAYLWPLGATVTTIAFVAGR